MSWLPSADPILGDKQSCDALEVVVVPRVRDLGDGFEVRRALPGDKRQMVGPFIFFDQMGPAQFLAGHGLDVRPHPHIGLATVTYLFDGRVMHRDSEGNVLEITPGAMNLMTAGRGIAHSERTPANARDGGDGLFGIQSWIALPDEYEEIEPSFQHFDAADLPVVNVEGYGRGLLPDLCLANAHASACSPNGSTPRWFLSLAQRRRSIPNTKSGQSMSSRVR
jgi:redox-sensitive bicupin YhaK (pirin superfamily)